MKLGKIKRRCQRTFRTWNLKTLKESKKHFYVYETSNLFGAIQKAKVYFPWNFEIERLPILWLNKTLNVKMRNLCNIEKNVSLKMKIQKSFNCTSFAIRKKSSTHQQFSWLK